MSEKTFMLKQSDDFITNTFKKALLPCMLSILSANINVIVDGVLIGQKLGSNALAAINLCLPVFLFMCVIGSFVVSGTAINASREIGKGNYDLGNIYYNFSIVITFAFSILFTILGFVFINQIVDSLCNISSIRPFVYEYTYITISGSLPKIMIYIPLWYLRLDGKNKDVSIMMSILTFGNIVLDVLFVYIFDFRVFGAGLASVVATSFSFAYGAACLLDDNCSFRLNLKIDLDKIDLVKITKDGFPSSYNNLCAAIRLLIINSMLIIIGGGTLVAIFTAVNGIFSIGEAIVLGIPQAGTAMLGVYSGEKDNRSCEIVIKKELLLGLIFSVIYSAVIIAMSPFLNTVYGIEQSIFIPCLWMCLSVFPALVCNIFVSYYNILGINSLSLFIITSRTLIMTYVGLVLVYIMNFSTFSFLFVAEVITLFVLFIITWIIYIRHKELHRFMLCNMQDEINGNILNFSIENNVEKICEGCELISEFCEGNGLTPKETMKIQLAMEEAMTLISDKNCDSSSDLTSFDLRIFNIAKVIGIRIRYAGIDFDPFVNSDNSLEYMGIRMIKDMLEVTTYQRTFGVNSLIMLLKDNRDE